jgi:two-component system, OmpR family, sensor histidine kinase SenX3
LPFYFLLLPYNKNVRRRKSTIFFLVLGICLIILAVALNVSWILLNLEKVVLLVLGIIFFAIIITGLVLNTTFLLREIKRNEQQDAFLNSVTHELKTPIASIRLYLETLKTRDVNEEKRQEFYNIMLKDSDRLLNTVEQVLHASRTRDEKKLTNAAEINPANLLQDSIEQIRSRYNFDENIISFTKTADFNIIGDANELQTVFTNLLDNAVKYSDKDVKISVELTNFDEKYAEIRIKDNGVGIAKNQLKRIFNRFYRIPSLSTQKAKGTGLGLFIVRFIVKKHGGKIFAESLGEGFGTTFRVQLPKK